MTGTLIYFLLGLAMAMIYAAPYTLDSDLDTEQHRATVKQRLAFFGLLFAWPLMLVGVFLWVLGMYLGMIGRAFKWGVGK